jgi:hypothetical protein
MKGCGGIVVGVEVGVFACVFSGRLLRGGFGTVVVRCLFAGLRLGFRFGSGFFLLRGLGDGIFARGRRFGMRKVGDGGMEG